jgi:predicted TIM-barrel fold metal-dependent hydrolase
VAVSNLADWVISVDDHVIEPPHLWQARLPRRFKARGPRIVHEDQGDFWHYDGTRVPINGLVTQAGFETATHNPRPARFADMPAYCYDADARLEAMNRDGVLASLCLPTFPRACGQAFSERPDRELGLLCIRAYNDFIIDEWCAADPGRFIPCIITSQEARLAAAEIERCAAKGAKSVTFSEQPVDMNLRSIHDPGRYWDPLFRAAEETGMTVSVHLGSSSSMPWAPPDASPMVSWAKLGWRAASTLTDWVFSDVLARFPKLKVDLAESGIGWLPSTLARLDYVHSRYGPWAERYVFTRDTGSIVDRGDGFSTWPHGQLTPTDVFRAHVRGCCIANQDGFVAETIHQIGSQYVLMETDFPHTDSTWPHSHEFIDDALKGFTADEQHALRRGNAEAWYGFKPATPAVAA